MDNNAFPTVKGVSSMDWRQNAMLCARKRFSDITNISFNGLGDGFVSDDQENWKIGSVVMSNEDIAKLLKENNVLMKALAERNTEVQTLRLVVTKMSQQNRQFAQTQSHMQAEINQIKDRMRVVQHELRCTSTALRAKTQELKEYKILNKQKKLSQKITIQANQHKPVDTTDACHSSSPRKASLSNRKRPQRSRSLGPNSVTNQVVTKEKDEIERKPLRKPSSAKVESSVPTEDLSEIQDAKFPICSGDESDSRSECCSLPAPATVSIMTIVKKEVGVETQIPIQPLNENLRRASLGRPSRKAAERVNSYKELPLNTKLRRSE